MDLYGSACNWCEYKTYVCTIKMRYEQIQKMKNALQWMK